MLPTRYPPGSRLVTGRLFLHRDPARVQAVQKNRNPGNNFVLIRVLTRL